MTLEDYQELWESLTGHLGEAIYEVLAKRPEDVDSRYRTKWVDFHTLHGYDREDWQLHIEARVREDGLILDCQFVVRPQSDHLVHVPKRFQIPVADTTLVEQTVESMMMDSFPGSVSSGPVTWFFSVLQLRIEEGDFDEFITPDDPAFDWLGDP